MRCSWGLGYPSVYILGLYISIELCWYTLARCQQVGSTKANMTSLKAVILNYRTTSGDGKL